MSLHFNAIVWSSPHGSDTGHCGDACRLVGGKNIEHKPTRKLRGGISRMYMDKFVHLIYSMCAHLSRTHEKQLPPI